MCLLFIDTATYDSRKVTKQSFICNNERFTKLTARPDISLSLINSFISCEHITSHGPAFLRVDMKKSSFMARCYISHFLTDRHTFLFLIQQFRVNTVDKSAFNKNHEAYFLVVKVDLNYISMVFEAKLSFLFYDFVFHVCFPFPELSFHTVFSLSCSTFKTSFFFLFFTFHRYLICFSFVNEYLLISLYNVTIHHRSLGQGTIGQVHTTN